MTREQARAYFKEKGLTYNDITQSDLHVLKDMLTMNMAQQRKRLCMEGRREEMYWYHMNSATRYKGEFKGPENTLVCAFLTARGEYFTAREVISFNRDGFIGLCGAADNKNAVPVIEAFIEWSDWLAEKKEGRK